MGLKISPEVRKYYEKLSSIGGKARAAKYDHKTLSEWAKKGGRPRKDAQGQEGQAKSAPPREKGRRK